MGHTVPLLLLDTDLEENDARDRVLTDHLYGGDERYRLCQEAVLGLGGVQMLQALGHPEFKIYHMNEGHSALATIALLEQLSGMTGRRFSETDIETVRRQCVFTTHTPVPAGHDRFPAELVRQVLGENREGAPAPAGGLGRFSQYDRAGAASVRLRQCGLDAAWRGLAPDVPRASCRSHY